MVEMVGCQVVVQWVVWVDCCSCVGSVISVCGLLHAVCSVRGWWSVSVGQVIAHCLNPCHAVSHPSTHCVHSSYYLLPSAMN